MPIIANGDVRSPEDALSMMHETGCAAVAIGRGAMLDPWIFRRIQSHLAGDVVPYDPTPDEKIDFLVSHFALMTQQHDDYACILFRKFAAWYGATLGIPEDLKTACAALSHSRSLMRSWNRFDSARANAKRSSNGVDQGSNGPVEHW